MSETQTQTEDRIDELPEKVQWIEQRREKLEREANSDMPDAWVFQRLLDYADAEKRKRGVAQ